ncbi:MAG: hypothetical protein QOH60_748 [Mycobacterium sp.]|nr:hypothetical protein [Mycobacterium sp.]
MKQVIVGMVGMAILAFGIYLWVNHKVPTESTVSVTCDRKVMVPGDKCVTGGHEESYEQRRDKKIEDERTPGAGIVYTVVGGLVVLGSGISLWLGRPSGR